MSEERRPALRRGRRQRYGEGSSQYADQEIEVPEIEVPEIEVPVLVNEYEAGVEPVVEEPQEPPPAIPRRRRGASETQKAPMREGEMKPFVKVVSDRKLTTVDPCLHQRLMTTIGKLACGRMSFSCRSYHDFSRHDKLEFHADFLSRYQWMEGQDPGKGLTALDYVAGERYYQELHQRRKDAIKICGDNKILWKTVVPHWCKFPQFWEGLCDYWNTIEWSQLSATNKNNRTVRGHLVHHHSGNRPTFITKEIMKAANNGVEPSAFDLYRETKLPKSVRRLLAAGAAVDDADLPFPNTKAKGIYDRATQMRADENYAGMENKKLFWIANRKKLTHGHVYGLPDCVSEDSLSTMRRRNSGRYAYGGQSTVTSDQMQDADNVPRFTQAQLNALLEDQRAQAEARDRERAAELEYHRHLVFNLYETVGQPLPSRPSQTSNQMQGQTSNPVADPVLADLEDHVDPASNTVDEVFNADYYFSNAM